MRNRGVFSEEGWVVTSAYSVTGIEGPEALYHDPFIILGPHEMGAQAILEEGAWIQEPKVTNPDIRLVEKIGHDFQISICGLRHVLWDYEESEIPAFFEAPEMSEFERQFSPVVASQPQSIALIGLAEAVSILRENCPAHIEFMEMYTIKRIHNLLIAIRPGSTQPASPAAAEYAQSLQDLALDATTAFGEDRLKSLIEEDNQKRRQVHEQYGQKYNTWKIPTAQDIKDIRQEISEQNENNS